MVFENEKERNSLKIYNFITFFSRTETPQKYHTKSSQQGERKRSGEKEMKPEGDKERREREKRERVSEETVKEREKSFS